MDRLSSVVGQQLCSPDEIHITVVRKVVAITGGNFVVTDDKVNVMFTVKEKLLCLHGRHVLVDAQGYIIITLKKKMLSAHRRWQVFKGDSSEPHNLLFVVVKSSLVQFKTEVDVILDSNKEENSWDFKVVGGWLERSCAIYDSNSTAIALNHLSKEVHYFTININMKTQMQMQKQHMFGGIVIGKDTYSVIVYPNVDSVFIVALVVILHESTRIKPIDHQVRHLCYK